MENTAKFGQHQIQKTQQCEPYKDSPFTDNLHTPRVEIRLTKGGTPHPDCLDLLLETPKENLSQKLELDLSVNLHRKDWPREYGRTLEKESKRDHTLQTSWCETPKLSKKDASLRRRLLVSRSVTESKISSTKTPGSRDTTFSLKTRLDRLSTMSSGDFDSPDPRLMEALATSTLKVEDIVLSCRKRRIMFSQVITSTLEDGKNVAASPSFPQSQAAEVLTDPDLDESIISGLPGLSFTQTPETPVCGKFLPLAKENFPSPASSVTANLSDSLSVLSTPSFTPTSKLNASVSEDSGFNSLGLDKSQDSSVDHEGSFQELLLPLSSKSREKRRSRLERQRRLSTLKEGGSQSEEDPRLANPVQRKDHCNLKGPRDLLREDEVFQDRSPHSVTREKLQDLSLTPALQMMQAMSRRSAHMLPEQISLEELLRTSEEAGTDGTTMSLSGLIGRKMGLGELDVLAELKMRNLRHILAMILKHLSPEDICRFGQVSNIWEEIVLQDKKACRRRRSHLKDLKIAFELGGVAHVPDAETRLHLECRSALRSVQAQSKTPGSHTPVGKSPFTPIQPRVSHSSSKRDEFLQVAKTLFSDECLRPCPRCQHPARCHAVKKEGVCSWAECGFQFCTACLCVYHGSRECVNLSVKPRNRRDVLPGSAQSKRNVRRL